MFNSYVKLPEGMFYKPHYFNIPGKLSDIRDIRVKFAAGWPLVAHLAGMMANINSPHFGEALIGLNPNVSWTTVFDWAPGSLRMCRQLADQHRGQAADHPHHACGSWPQDELWIVYSYGPKYQLFCIYNPINMVYAIDPVEITTCNL